MTGRIQVNTCLGFAILGWLSEAPENERRPSFAVSDIVNVRCHPRLCQQDHRDLGSRMRLGTKSKNELFDFLFAVRQPTRGHL